MRRAKIVCTLDPVTDSQEEILTLARVRADVTRISAPHGTHAEHEERIRRVHKAAEITGQVIAVPVDLQDPKIRLGHFANGPHDLAVGDIFSITTGDVPGTKELVSTTYEGLPGDCKPGDRILINNGKVTVRVFDVADTIVRTEVIVPDPISNNKSVNLPGVAAPIPVLSKKDREDLEWGLNFGTDFIALSFVRTPSDVDDVHEIMDQVGVRCPVIAKIEKPRAVENLEDIVRASDGTMVAQGDLGAELPLEQTPLVQKRTISLARKRSKPVIVVTQIFDFMIDNPRLTRAEASNCANAVMDGADAVMLSGETFVGKSPIECVETMSSTIEYTEEHGMEQIPLIGNLHRMRNGVITHAAMGIGEALGVKDLVVFTETGQTTRREARLCARLPILYFTPDLDMRSQLTLTQGLTTFTVPRVKHTDDAVAQVDHLLRELGMAMDGDRIVVVTGMPAGESGSTNTIRVHKMSETLPRRG